MKKLQLWAIYQNHNTHKDAIRKAIVAAYDAESAKNIFPCHSAEDPSEAFRIMLWARSELVEATLSEDQNIESWHRAGDTLQTFTRAELMGLYKEKGETRKSWGGSAKLAKDPFPWLGLVIAACIIYTIFSGFVLLIEKIETLRAEHVQNIGHKYGKSSEISPELTQESAK